MKPATPAYADVLALIHMAAFPPGARWGPDALALQLGLPGAFGWIDEAGGMVLARVAADEAEILTLAVVPAVQRTGLGRRLLQQAMSDASGRGAASMVLEVGESNAAARALYANVGSLPFRRRARYYGSNEDAFIMRAELRPG